MNSFDKVTNQFIILDTCIFIDLTNIYLRSAIANLLFQLRQNNNRFRYSQYSIFELLRGQSKKISDKYKKLLEIAKPFPISTTTLLKASDLMCNYKYNRTLGSPIDNKIKNENKIDDGDYIIGASAFQYKQTCILTRNYSDFPRPFFTELGKYYVDFIFNKKQACTAYYILEPDIYYENKISQIRN